MDLLRGIDEAEEAEDDVVLDPGGDGVDDVEEPEWK